MVIHLLPTIKSPLLVCHQNRQCPIAITNENTVKIGYIVAFLLSNNFLTCFLQVSQKIDSFFLPNLDDANSWKSKLVDKKKIF